MYNRLEEVIKHVKGNVLIIGLDDKLKDYFYKTDKINLYSIDANNNDHGSVIKKHKMKTNKGKNINIKKLRKYINKKSVDYMFCNMDVMFPYYKYFIKDSIYLNNYVLYIYASNNIDKSLIISKYKRYNVKISLTDYKNGFIIEIDNKNSKNNIIKDKIYFIKDTLYNAAEFIGNILVG